MNRAPLIFGATALLFFCAFANAEKHPKALAPVAPVITDTISYPLPLEDHAKARDLQLRWDELEIENQKMLVKIEENKQQQEAAMVEIRKIFYQFAQARQIDLQLYEPDAKELKFVGKKKALK